MNSSRRRNSDHGVAATIEDAAAVVDELLAAIPPDEPFDAQSFLEAHPELNDAQSAILDIAYEEFCRRVEGGEAVEPRAFAAKFPHIRSSLMRLIDVHHLFQQGVPSIPAKPISWPLPGETWLDFKLLEEIGRGAFSRVFVARDQALGNRLVVVKATPLGPQEAETLGRLGHLHVVPVHSVQRDDRLGLTAVCMPFLSRVSLFDVIDGVHSAPQPPVRAARILDVVRRLNSTQKGHAPEADPGPPWPARRSFLDGVLEIGIQLTGALSHAHRQGVLHCDVKPSNILLTNRGRAILLDFNLSRAADGAVSFVGGTVPYMAPEQIAALLSGASSCPNDWGSATDIFGLGVTLFELAYGRLPFGELPVRESSSAVAQDLLERQRQGVVYPDGAPSPAARPIAAIIARCLEFEPARRPQSMDELNRLLTVELRAANRARRWYLAHRRMATLAAVIVCACALAVGGWLWMREPFPIREYQQGRMEFDRGDTNSAVRHLSRALESNPRLADARLLRACAHFQRNDFASAYGDFGAHAQETKDGRGAAGLGQVMSVMREDFSHAALFYRQAAEEGYGTPAVYNNMGYCFIKGGGIPEANEALKTAVLLDPRLPGAFHNLSRAEMSLSYQQRRAPETAAIEEALRLGPEAAELYLDAASLYARRASLLTDPEQQRSAFERTFTLLERAIERGISRQHLAAVSSRNKQLQDDKRWQGLEDNVLPGGSNDRARLLIDLLPELSAASGPAVAGY